MAEVRVWCFPKAVCVAMWTVFVFATITECRAQGSFECISTDDMLLKNSPIRSNSAKYAPRFRKQDQLAATYINSEDDDIKRKCRATGNPEPTVSWLFNNKTLQPSERVVMRRGSLVIYGLMHTNEGIYTCVVQNECGTIRRSFAQTVVVDPVGGKISPVLLHNKENKTVYEGDEAHFDCIFFSNDPPIVFWNHYPSTNNSATEDLKYRILKININSPQRYVISKAQLNDSGVYECIIQNIYGNSGRRQWLTVLPLPETSEIPELLALKDFPDDNNTAMIVLIVMAVVVVIGVVITVIIVAMCQRKRRQMSHTKQREAINIIYPFIPQDQMNIPHDPEWEFPRESLELGDILGIGFFGQVSKGFVIGLRGQMEPAIVAVKMLKPDATQRELNTLVQEMNTMKSIGDHINIINFLGCCTQDGPLYMLVEYAEHGNLRDFLRQHKPKDLRHPLNSWVCNGYETPQDYQAERSIIPLAAKDLVSYAYQIARGMEYLSSKKIIHRDLAARNILVGNGYILKIADFGLTKELRDTDYYTKQTETPLPIKWMALECLRDKKFTPKSDVWSFGILLWEIFTFGGNPYPSVNVLSHEKFYDWLEEGNRMDKPRHSPDEMYALMLKCWKAHVIDRPSFTELVMQLDSMLVHFTNKIYLNLDMNLDYISPVHERNDDTDTTVDTDEETDEGAGSLVRGDEYLEDNVFSEAHDQTKLLVTTKNSERADSQYASLPSSQDQSTKDDQSLRSSDGNNTYDSMSQRSYSTTGGDDIRYYDDINHNSLRTVANPVKYTLSPTWSKSADDVAKMQSPLLNSLCYHSERHISDDYDSNTEESLEKDPPMCNQSKRPRKPCRSSADSTIYISSEEDAESSDNEVHRLAHVIVYSTDKVECVESFV